MGEKTTFSYKNYLKPTPDNIQYLVTGAKSVLVTAAATSFVSGNQKVAFWIMIGGAVLDEAAKFFARVAHDVDHTTE